jgi:integrase
MTAERCIGLGMRDTARGSLKPELRSFASHEVVCFWAACGETPDPFGTLFKILLATGIRSICIIGARCTDIDFRKRVWNLPAWPYPWAMPLTAETERLLRRVCGDRLSQEERVFQIAPDRAISAATLARACTSLAKTMDSVCQREFPGMSIATWNIETVRLTVRFWLTYNQGPVITDLVLGRKNDGIRGQQRVASTVTHDALEAWETALMAILGDR